MLTHKILSGVRKWCLRNAPALKREFSISDSRAARNRELNDRLPINRLPSEILVLIFDDVVRDRCRYGEAVCSRGSGTIPIDEGYFYDDNHHGSVRPPNRKSLVKLTSICWYWRGIIIDTPYFWSRFDSRVSLSSNLLELWINRSKSSPLHMSIFTRADLDLDNPIMKNINRVESIELLNYGDFSFVPPNTHASHLKSLSISLFYNEGAHGPIDLTLNAPVLDNVYLNNITISPSSYAVFNNIRRLTLTQTGWRLLEELTVEQVLQIVAHCQTTLVELEVRTTDLHHPHGFIGRTLDNTLVLERLRRLVWEATNTSPNLLGFIAAPALRTLHVVVEEINIEEDLSQFIPVSFVHLSKWSPLLLHAYRPYTSSFGINLYADSARNHKLLAFSLRNVHVGGPLGDGNFEAFFQIFFEAFLRAHNLLILKYTMLSDIPANAVQNVYKFNPEMNVKIQQFDINDTGTM